MANAARRLFPLVMFWSAFTSIFAWLPLVRIIGRPDGYTWGVLGFTGAGLEGPFWIFVAGTAFVVTMLFCTLRGPRALAYPMLVLWHLGVCAIVFAGALAGGEGATWQGQGLHFEFRLLALCAPFAAFTAAVLTWAVLDARSADPLVRALWTRVNTRRLLVSVTLLVVALALFRAGTNYNWVTAAAIVVTIAHWIALVRAFEPITSPDPQRVHGQPAGPRDSGDDAPPQRIGLRAF